MRLSIQNPSSIVKTPSLLMSVSALIVLVILVVVGSAISSRRQTEPEIKAPLPVQSHNGEPPLTSQSNNIQPTQDLQLWESKKFGYTFRAPRNFFIIDASHAMSKTEEIIILCKQKDCNNEDPSLFVMADYEFTNVPAEQAFDRFSTQSYSDHTGHGAKEHRVVNDYLVIQKEFADGFIAALISDGKKAVMVQNNSVNNSVAGKQLFESIIQSVRFTNTTSPSSPLAPPSVNP